MKMKRIVTAILSLLLAVGGSIGMIVLMNRVNTWAGIAVLVGCCILLWIIVSIAKKGCPKCKSKLEPCGKIFTGKIRSKTNRATYHGNYFSIGAAKTNYEYEYEQINACPRCGFERRTKVWLPEVPNEWPSDTLNLLLD
jgi:hypothetical protein